MQIVNSISNISVEYEYSLMVKTFLFQAHIYQPLRSGRIWHQVNFFKRSLTGLNTEFSFSKTSCLTKAEELSLSYYLPIAGGRIIGFILFPRVLVLCEMQSVSARIWTRVAVFISYDDNHYTTRTSSFLFQAIQFSQTILIQLIHFSISTDFVYTKLNVKTVLYWTI